MLKVLIVHQPLNPTNGGGDTFQRNILETVGKRPCSDIQFISISSNLVNHTLVGQLVTSYEIDLVWFLYPERNIFPVPHIATLWDIGHRDFPVFPELTVNGATFSRREDCCTSMTAAFRVFTGSEFLKSRLHHLYGIDEHRIVVNRLPLPMDVPAICDYNHRAPHGRIRQLLYPAQFWPHKNHYTLINGLSKLVRNTGGDYDYELHLTGADKGNELFLKDLVNVLDLSGKVHFHGFVDQSKLHSLYKSAFCLIFPSLLGPDNLPPLEAMAFGCPVVLAGIPGAYEVYSDSVLYFDPLDSDALANRVRDLEDTNTRVELTNRGYSLVKARTLAVYLDNVVSTIREFIALRKLYNT